ncbi:MAG TPA: sigma factor, partial [Polyangiaceae bacterium]|nr:sigma factor [Polyangiaceae bacterium]
MTTPLSNSAECSAPRPAALKPDCTLADRSLAASSHAIRAETASGLRANALGAAELRARSIEIQNGLREHLPALQRHAARRARSREEALDLVQETALRALAFAWSFERGTNLRAWLHQVQDSVFLTQCRKRTRERRAFDAFYLDPCAWPKHGAEPAMQRMTQSGGRA